MAERPLKNQIIDWLKGYDYWFQYAGNRLLEGDPVTEELTNSTYVLFKEDYGLKEKEGGRKEINFNEIADNNEAKEEHIQLQAIKISEM